MIPPHGATAEGTRHYFERVAKVHPDKIHRMGDLSVSALGLGTYLGGSDDATDKAMEEAVALAVASGINLIDTAINYRCQRSERSIGRALKKLFASGNLSRNEVVVATKGGFIPYDDRPAPNMEAVIRAGWVDKGIMAMEDVVASCHCLHPAFIRNQVEASLKNLGLDTVDIYFLHKPEMEIPEVGEVEFYLRLERAFSVLEEMADKGKIQSYGLATWNAFREPEDGKERILLERVVELAKSLAGENHHFRAIQLPYNMAMLEAVGTASQPYKGKNYPVLAVANELKLSVLASATLLQGQLPKLNPSLASKVPGAMSMAVKALQFASSTPGVTAALAGMKTKEHVIENSKVLNEADWDAGTLQGVCDLLVKR